MAISHRGPYLTYPSLVWGSRRRKAMMPLSISLLFFMLTVAVAEKYHVNPMIYASPPPPPPHHKKLHPPGYKSPPPPHHITYPPPGQIYPPPPPQTESSGETRQCKNKNYHACYLQKVKCPAHCPLNCEIDCKTCRARCDCDKPGTMCQDPRFIGGDGVMFYFHGKKDKDFCIVSDTNLHINAHFIGRRNVDMKRDFTWVQSLGIMFGKHRLFIGARRTSTWDDSIDRLSLALDDEPIFLPFHESAKWNSISSPSVTITRTRDTNAIEISVEGNFKIKATVVPITKKDSMIHKYGITDEDCFAHLDLSFKFYALSGNVTGVLGQTYADNYVSRVKMSSDMPILGGNTEYASSDIFSTDCPVSRFNKGFPADGDALENIEYSSLSCATTETHGVICKR